MDDLRGNTAFGSAKESSKIFKIGNHKPSQGNSEDAPYQPHNNGFAQDHAQDTTALPAHRAQDTNFTRPLNHSHQLGIHHAHTANDDGQSGDNPNEGFHNVTHHLFVGEVIGCTQR